MLELRYISKVHEIVRSLVEQLRAVIVEGVVLEQGRADAGAQEGPHGKDHEQYASHDAGDQSKIPFFHFSLPLSKR